MQSAVAPSPPIAPGDAMGEMFASLPDARLCVRARLCVCTHACICVSALLL